MTDPTLEPGLEIGEVVLQSVRFEHRDDFLMLPRGTPVRDEDVLVGVEVFAGQFADPAAPGGRALAGMTITVETKPSDPPALYSFRIQMLATVLSMPGRENMPPLDFVLQSGAATIFPFIREAIANITMRGRFGPLWLSPANVMLLAADVQRKFYDQDAETVERVRQAGRFSPSSLPSKPPSKRKAKK